MITIGLITTNHPKRFSILEKTIKSIDEKTDIKEKLISVDEFLDINTNKQYFDKYQDTGWKIVYKKHTGKNSMVTNQLNLLNNIKTEWVFYCEDDITFRKFPNINFLSKILNEETGFISLSGHITEFPNKEIINYCLDNKNYLKIDNLYLLKKDINYFQHMWYLNFPSCIIRCNELRQCLDHSTGNFKNLPISIEEGLSKSWISNIKSIKKYNEYIILDKVYLNEENILQNIHNNSIMNYWNNDPTTRIESINQKSSMWF